MTVEIKICALTSLDDARMALDAGADYLGFVLYPKSPRGIAPAAMRRILDGLDRPFRAVAVAVNETRRQLEQVASECGLWAVQLHGDEPPSEFSGCPFRVWRALRVGSAGCDPAPDGWAAERYVVDAAVPGMYGGTSIVADWGAAANLAGRLPVMLAGGLNPENVADAIKSVWPLGVDVASGVESAPGRKDPEKVRRFVAAVRKAAAGK